MTSDQSTKGRNARKRGNRAEVQVVNWLRSVGWPDARRYLAGDGRQPGDVSWHPLIVLEVKDVAASSWPTWCRQAVAECAPGQVPCVVRRTRGVPDVSQWRARVRLWEWRTVLGQPVALDEWLHDVDHDAETWPWVEVSMDELANAVAAVDRSSDR